MIKVKNKKQNKLTIITMAFLMLVNIVVLVGVSYNRSDKTTDSLQLTEREMSLPYRSYRKKENSGMALKLNWSIVSTELFSRSYNKYTLQRYGSPNWMTDEKLKELGLYIDGSKLDVNDSIFDYGRMQGEEFIVVLEYNGETFQSVLRKSEKDIKILRAKVGANPNDTELVESLKQDETSLMELKTSESRLIAIDAGRNLKLLKQKYADKSKYLMLRGELRRHWRNKKLTASIGQFFINRIHMPLPYSKVINGITNHETSSDGYMWSGKPRYRVELNVGERLEPWVSAVGEL